MLDMFGIIKNIFIMKISQKIKIMKLSNQKNYNGIAMLSVLMFSFNLKHKDKSKFHFLCHVFRLLKSKESMKYNLL